MTIMSAHKSAKIENFYWLSGKSLLFWRTYVSECLMTIMSAQYSHRKGVQVLFVRDEMHENQKEACFSRPLCSCESLFRSPAEAADTTTSCVVVVLSLPSLRICSAVKRRRKDRPVHRLPPNAAFFEAIFW